MKKFLFFNLSIIFTISSVLIAATEQDNTSFIEAHVTSKKENKGTYAPKSRSERLSLFSKGMGYAGLSLGCAACMYVMLNKAYGEFCDDRVTRTRQELMMGGNLPGSENYQKLMAKVWALNAYCKTFYLVAPLCAAAAAGSAVYKYRFLPNSWKHIKAAFN